MTLLSDCRRPDVQQPVFVQRVPKRIEGFVYALDTTDSAVVGPRETHRDENDGRMVCQTLAAQQSTQHITTAHNADQLAVTTARGAMAIMMH